MASGPINSWEIDGETVADFIFLGSKLTADGDCSHEIERRLLLGRKAMTNLDSMLKSRDTTLPTKIHLVKAMVFPVVMSGYDHWTIRKVECRRIIVQLSHPYMTTGKTIALTRRTFVGKVMSLFLNMLSRLVITFLPRSMQSSSAVILEPKKMKSATVSPSVCHEVIGPVAMIFVF